MSKLTILSLTAALLFTGCGKKKDNAGGGSSSATPSAAAATAAPQAEQLAITDYVYYKAADGTVKVWGNNPEILGQKANEDGSATKPTAIPELAKTKRLATGGGQTMCAAMLDGSVKCWGNGASGQLGDLKVEKSDKPVVVPGVTNAADVAIGGNFACALIGDGTVKCWGYNQFNTASVEKADKVAPTTVPDVTGVKQIALANDGSCALSNDGTVKCWGLSCGAPGPNLCVKPYTVEKFANATYLAGSSESICAVMKDATVQCFGNNNYGVLGIGTNDHTETGAINPVKGLAGVKQLAAGASHYCALMNDGTVQCWGSNEYGQLGDGKTPEAEAERATPAPVVGVSDATSLTCGSSGTCCAQLKDKSLKCWGENGMRFGDVVKDGENVSTAVAVAL